MIKVAKGYVSLDKKKRVKIARKEEASTY